ncbi:MAG: hypothetical protein WDO17_11235 [Alphaproteobacteria bacterium]
MQYRRPHRGFTPEAIADIRYRYEETDEPQSSIAADYGIHSKTLDRLAKSEGFKLRKDRAKRDLPGDVRLAKEGEQAVRAVAVACIAEGTGEGEAYQAERRAGAVAPARLSVADRLERAVEKELAAVELVRASLGSQPHFSSAEAERTARILERLTDTLWKVRRLRAPDMPGSVPDDFDDMPKDIDEFRRTLARRIEAFVRSRYGGGLPSAGEAVGGAPPEQ